MFWYSPPCLLFQSVLVCSSWLRLTTFIKEFYDNDDDALRKYNPLPRLTMPYLLYISGAIS